LALELPSAPRARGYFSLAFYSTSRVPMRRMMENTGLLCFREVAKFLHEGRSLGMMRPTMNLSGNTHVNCSSSSEMDGMS
jgi:hypothetical protein